MRPRNTRKIPTWVTNTVASTDGWNAGVKAAMKLMSHTLALDSAVRRSELVRLLSEDNLLDAGAVRMEINTLTRIHNTLVQDLNDLIVGKRIQCPCQLMSGDIPSIRELTGDAPKKKKQKRPSDEELEITYPEDIEDPFWQSIRQDMLQELNRSYNETKNQLERSSRIVLGKDEREHITVRELDELEVHMERISEKDFTYLSKFKSVDDFIARVLKLQARARKTKSMIFFYDPNYL